MGVCAMIISTVIFSIMGVLVKIANQMGMDTFKTALFRFAIGAALLGTLAMLKRIRLEFNNSRLLVTRGLLGGVAVFLYFLAITKIGLAKGTVISSSSPIFATIGGIIFLGEKSSLRKWVLVFLACGGICLIVAGKGVELGGFGLYELLAVTGAAAAGCAYVVIKKLSITDSTYAIFMAQCVFGFWLVVVPANLIPCKVGIGGGVILVLVGLTATIGQLFMTYGFRYVGVSTGSLLGLLTVVFNLLVGIMIFRERVQFVSTVGIVLVLLSCAAIVLTDERDVRDAAA